MTPVSERPQSALSSHWGRDARDPQTDARSAPAELLHDAAAGASFDLAGIPVNYTMLAAGLGFAAVVYLSYRWTERLAKA